MFNILRYETGMSERELSIFRAIKIENRSKFILLEELHGELLRIKGLGEEKVRDELRELITLMTEEQREILAGMAGLQAEIIDEKKSIANIAEKYDKREIILTKKIETNLEFQLKELKMLLKIGKADITGKIKKPVAGLIRICERQLNQDKMLISFDIKLLKLFESQRKSKKGMAVA
jgi:hypothetical protein